MKTVSNPDCYSEVSKAASSIDLWNDFVFSLKNESDSIIKEKGFFYGEGESRLKIAKSLDSAILNLPDKFALLFSGGVDSAVIAVIAKRLNKNFTCFLLGDDSSKDVLFARKIAKDYSLDLIEINPDDDAIVKALKEVSFILDTKEYVTLSIALVLFFCLEKISESGFLCAVTGLGSEEIFAGYQRHLDSFNNGSDLYVECWKGVSGMFSRDVLRDFPVADYFGITLVSPFLCRDVILSAMSSDPKLKIKDGVKKYVLRLASLDLGLSEEYAMRKKLAAQYGSNMDKRIGKIARSYGMKKSDFVRSL